MRSFVQNVQNLKRMLWIRQKKKYEADCENLLFTIMLKFMFVLNIWLYLLAVAGFVYVSIAFVNYDILI